MAVGRQGCPCINASSTLSSLPERICEIYSTGETGVRLTVEGNCVPFSYGSSRCLQHDLYQDPACQPENIFDDITPPYCFRPWCYVNADVCKKDSNERVYRSTYFSFDTGVDLFWSYSTCNSTADDWLEVESDKVLSGHLDQSSINAVIPNYVAPLIFKKNPTTGEILTVTGDDYYDSEIPYEGVYIDFVENIRKFSKGDIQNITFTHRSKASSIVHPTSTFTAAVQDIQDGLVDMSVGPFWITRDRLKMAAFTVPIVQDRTLLVIPKPGSDGGLRVSKVMMPLESQLWVLVGAIIIVTGLLSVWFRDKAKLSTDRRRSLRQKKDPLRRRKRAYARLAIDAILEEGIFFCSAGVSQERGASLPHNILMFGFGFFILITVSAFVANLAAFLTRKTLEGSVTSIEGAIANKWKVCAHPTLRNELQTAWPAAQFVFDESGNAFDGVLDAYVAKKCDALAIGWEDTSMDIFFLDRLCEENLVFTQSTILEVPVAFPIRPRLAAGFSYWIFEAEKKHDFSLQTAKDEHTKKSGTPRNSSCELWTSLGETETNDYDQITIEHMALPIIFYATCCILAIVGQLVHMHCRRKGRESASFFARTSQLTLTTNEPSHFGRLSSRPTPVSDYNMDVNSEMGLSIGKEEDENFSEDYDPDNFGDGTEEQSRFKDKPPTHRVTYAGEQQPQHGRCRRACTSHSNSGIEV